MKVGLFLAEDTREFKNASEMDDSTNGIADILIQEQT